MVSIKQQLVIAFLTQTRRGHPLPQAAPGDSPVTDSVTYNESNRTATERDAP